MQFSNISTFWRIIFSRQFQFPTIHFCLGIIFINKLLGHTAKNRKQPIRKGISKIGKREKVSFKVFE